VRDVNRVGRRLMQKGAGRPGEENCWVLTSSNFCEVARGTMVVVEGREGSELDELG
jgi:hypothetical protein